MFKNEEGFSLLELVVAVGVAGIIAAVALPTFAGIQAHATSTSATYAASASAAEALANSTIGNTGSTNSSNTGGSASSSAYQQSQIMLTVANVQYVPPFIVSSFPMVQLNGLSASDNTSIVNSVNNGTYGNINIGTMSFTMDYNSGVAGGPALSVQQPDGTYNVTLVLMHDFNATAWASQFSYDNTSVTIF